MEQMKKFEFYISDNSFDMSCFFEFGGCYLTGCAAAVYGEYMIW